LILRRLSTNLKAQDWTAISIELILVIVGVFVGTQVSNWNADRLERGQTQRMLVQLKPELRGMISYFENAREYYATTRSYAQTAFSGWDRDPGISDEQFVIAAYQASQIIGIGTDGQNWALIFGAQRLQNIEDAQLRRALSTLMASDFTTVANSAVSTKYRENVRRVIRDSVQVAIRDHCGDRLDPARSSVVALLPQTCRLRIPPAIAASVASALRKQPGLVGDLRWHLAAVANLLTNIDILDQNMRDLEQRIKE
jgi:hypothetical protein